MSMLAQLGTLALLLTPTQAQQARLTKQFEQLQQKYRAEQSKYYEPYMKAKTDAEVAKIKLDPKLNPNPRYAPKFEQLALKAKGMTPLGLNVELTLVQCCQEPRDAVRAKKALDRLMTVYRDKELGGLGLYAIETAANIVGGPKGPALVEEKMALLMKTSKNRETRAAVLGRTADEYGSSWSPKHDARKAMALYKELLAKYQGTKAAAGAKNAMFELEHLQIGMPAPEVTATDEKGEAWKLSDYRGKVVVLDFWGFW